VIRGGEKRYWATVLRFPTPCEARSTKKNLKKGRHIKQADEEGAPRDFGREKNPRGRGVSIELNSAGRYFRLSFAW